MDLLGDLGMTDQLTSVRAENAVLQEKVKSLTARVQVLTVENESLKAEVELYRRDNALPTFSQMALGNGNAENGQAQSSSQDHFVRSGNNVYPQTNAVTVPQLHGRSNISACALSPDDVVLATGGADATLTLVPWGAVPESNGNTMDTTNDNTTAIPKATVACPAPVIAISFSPTLRGVLAVGCMDGSVGLVHYQSATNNSSNGNNPKPAFDTTLFHPVTKKHAKYVRNVCWSPTDNLLASTSADGCIYMYKVDQQTKLVPMTDGDDHDEEIQLEAELTESLHLDGAVEACCFAAGQLICYVRGTPHLTYFDLEKDMQQTKINLNQSSGDQSATAGGFSDHVSFCILDLRPYQDQYLAAATDTSRNIVLELRTGKILRNLYGHQNDGFSQPKLCWSLNGQYIMGNTQDEATICVWDIASQQIVKRLEGHGQPPRDLCSGSTMDVMVSTSFDKSTRLWFAE